MLSTCGLRGFFLTKARWQLHRTGSGLCRRVVMKRRGLCRTTAATAEDDHFRLEDDAPVLVPLKGKASMTAVTIHVQAVPSIGTLEVQQSDPWRKWGQEDRRSVLEEEQMDHIVLQVKDTGPEKGLSGLQWVVQRTGSHGEMVALMARGTVDRKSVKNLAVTIPLHLRKLSVLASGATEIRLSSPRLEVGTDTDDLLAFVLQNGDFDASGCDLACQKLCVEASGSGSIRLRSVRGEVRASTAKGSIDARRLQGPRVTLEAGDEGDIHVAALYAEHSRVKSEGRGTIHLANVHGACYARAADGRLDIVGLDGSLEAEVVRGEAEVRIARLSPGSQSTVDVHQGEVRVVLSPEVMPLDFQLEGEHVVNHVRTSAAAAGTTTTTNNNVTSATFLEGHLKAAGPSPSQGIPELRVTSRRGQVTLSMAEHVWFPFDRKNTDS